MTAIVVLELCWFSYNWKPCSQEELDLPMLSAFITVKRKSVDLSLLFDFCFLFNLCCILVKHSFKQLPANVSLAPMTESGLSRASNTTLPCYLPMTI